MGANLTIPDFLVFSDERVSLHRRENDDERDKHGATDYQLVISGSPMGFLTLANVLLYCLNEIVDRIQFESLPCVESMDATALAIEIYPEGSTDEVGPDGTVERLNDSSFRWSICEDTLVDIVVAVHKLAYSTGHIHLDHGMPKEAVSVLIESA